jgi:hypothetical protein
MPQMGTLSAQGATSDAFARQQVLCIKSVEVDGQPLSLEIGFEALYRETHARRGPGVAIVDHLTVLRRARVQVDLLGMVVDLD